jgi:hypothetical protein
MYAFILIEKGRPILLIIFRGSGGGGTLLPPPEGMICCCYCWREIAAIETPLTPPWHMGEHLHHIYNIFIILKIGTISTSRFNVTPHILW